MVFYSTYDILDEVYYKNLRPGIVTDVQFTLDEETGYMIETYGVTFEDDSYEMYISPSDLSYQQVIPQTQLS
jgi:hypothetical protein